jgi:hypothetical protein
MHMTKNHERILVGALIGLICSGAFALAAGNSSDQSTPKVASDKAIVGIAYTRRSRLNPL